MRRERQGGAILVAPRLSACMLALAPVNQSVASLRLWVGGGIGTVVGAYSPNSSPPSVGSLVRLGEFNDLHQKELSAFFPTFPNSDTLIRTAQAFYEFSISQEPCAKHPNISSSEVLLLLPFFPAEKLPK